MKLKDIELVKWNQISAEFQHVFPQLYPELDRLFKKNSCALYRARYSFADQVIQGGILHIPFGGKLVPVNSPDLPEEIRASLCYPHVSIPITAVTKGSLECYINLPTHLIPLRILKPGSFFSINSLLHQERVSHIIDTAYSYISGSRSMIMLPKISHEQYNERLARNYTIEKQHLCPKSFEEQWPLFRALAQAPEFPSSWFTELIFFPKEIFDLINQDMDLKAIFLNLFSKYNFFSQNQAMYDLAWSIFFEKLSAGIKNAPFILETVKHLIKLCISEALGYAPVTNNDQGPLKEFSDIYLNEYRIRYYLPAFMEASYFNRHDPIYYSLQKHTFFCNIPEKIAANRTIDELNSIKRLIQSFKQHVLENRFPFSLANTILYKTLQEVEFDFYHPQGTAELIADTESIVREDPRFMALLQGMTYDPALTFPMHSLFFNGCIRIRPIKKIAKPLMSDLMDTKRFASYRLDDKN